MIAVVFARREFLVIHIGEEYLWWHDFLFFFSFFAKLPFIEFHISFLLYVSSRSLTRGFIVYHAIQNLSLVYFHLINSTMVHTHVLAI